MEPMLAVAHKKLPLRFPLIASPKLDGIRAWSPEDTILSRKLKLFPNKGIYAKYEDLNTAGLDGEFCIGPTTALDLMRVTNSAVMSFDGDLEDLVWWIFDDCSLPAMPVYERLERVAARVAQLNRPDIKAVLQVLVHTEEQLRALEEEWLQLGYEGAMVRQPNSPYKFGRSTEKEGYLLKIKRFLDSEAEITGFIELEHNKNEATISETGHTKRSTKKEGKVRAGVLGAFEARDIETGIEFEIGGGFDAAMRLEFWEKRDELLGKVVKYKYFPVGVKEKPRFPIFLGFRNIEID